MKVKRTLHEIHSELTDLRETKRRMSDMIAKSSADGNNDRIAHYTEKYKHYDEVIKYLSRIEVEYEDKYETEEEEE